MSKLRYGLLAAVGMVLAGCGVPPALMVASYVAQGALVASSGKTLGGHALSAVAQQDCAMWRVLRGDDVCQDPAALGDADIMLASGQAPAAPISTQDTAAIQLAQVYLNNLGYDAGPIDGVAGSQTQTAIQAYEADLGRRADGTLTYDDLSVLSSRYGAAGANPGLADDPTTTVLFTQAHLSYFGYRPGPLNGISGQATRDAIVHFQHDKGIEADGQVDAALLAILRADLPNWSNPSVAAAPWTEPIEHTATAG